MNTHLAKTESQPPPLSPWQRGRCLLTAWGARPPPLPRAARATGRAAAVLAPVHPRWIPGHPLVGPGQSPVGPRLIPSGSLFDPGGSPTFPRRSPVDRRPARSLPGRRGRSCAACRWLLRLPPVPVCSPHRGRTGRGGAAAPRKNCLEKDIQE